MTDDGRRRTTENGRRRMEGRRRLAGTAVVPVLRGRMDVRATPVPSKAEGSVNEWVNTHKNRSKILT
jgi:hypothetical protein